MEKRFCPNCGSDNIDFVAGGMTGSFMCNDCEYSGSVFPTKGKSKDEEETDEDEMMEEEQIVLRNKNAKKIAVPIKPVKKINKTKVSKKKTRGKK
jgi:hypothetical protein